jgi:RNA polymerase sigma factor (sigma-70 family)
MAEERTPTWEDVARIYGRKIYNFAYRLTGNPDDAADLVQEVLLRVRKGLSSYVPGSFDGWLWRITRNAFLDGVRKRNRRPTSPLPDDDRNVIALWHGPGWTRFFPTFRAEPALLVQGDDHLGVLAEVHEKLYHAGVNVYASNAVTDGKGDFGYIIYVRPETFDQAARALGI